MSDARRDQNNIPTPTAALDTDGQTILNIKVNPSTHGIMIDMGTTGVDNGPVAQALIDGNSVATLIGVSEDDNETPVAAYSDANGMLLIDNM